MYAIATSILGSKIIIIIISLYDIFKSSLLRDICIEKTI